MRAARLKELEEIAAKLLETARKLPSGQDRHNALQEIERFRAGNVAQVYACRAAESMSVTISAQPSFRLSWLLKLSQESE